MNKDQKIKEWYLNNFDDFQKKINNITFDSNRKEALENFKSAKFPTGKDEEWKYTNVNPIIKNEFLPTPLLDNKKDLINSLDNLTIPNLEVHLLVFVNGIFNRKLSNIGTLEKGVIADSLYNLSKENNELLKLYQSKIGKASNIFNFLNNAFTYDGFVIYLPKNIIVEKPIHILNIASGMENKPLIQPRNLVITEENSIAKIITEYISIDESEYFTNVFTEISVAKNANLRFYKLQNESSAAYHIDKTEIIQKEKSVFNHFSLSFGSKITRNDISAKLDGENIETHLYGLYLGKDDQLIDHHTFIDHAKPNCMSNELYKGILDDKSHGVFSGKIMVNQIAQKTNAFQSNKSVLLSDNASIDTKPQLEIYADDVKCSHGATVGKLDEEAYFYIRSRGVSPESAKSMLIRAFIDDVVSEISIDELKEKVNDKIFEHLQREKF